MGVAGCAAAVDPEFWLGTPPAAAEGAGAEPALKAAARTAEEAPEDEAAGGGTRSGLIAPCTGLGAGALEPPPGAWAAPPAPGLAGCQGAGIPDPSESLTVGDRLSQSLAWFAISAAGAEAAAG